MVLASTVIFDYESSGTHDHYSGSCATLPVLPLSIPMKMLYAFVISSMRAIFTTHLYFIIY
jgi:hypothetical protein